jgi:hypothetical protein
VGFTSARIALSNAAICSRSFDQAASIGRTIGVTVPLPETAGKRSDIDSWDLTQSDPPQPGVCGRQTIGGFFFGDPSAFDFLSF